MADPGPGGEPEVLSGGSEPGAGSRWTRPGGRLSVLALVVLLVGLVIGFAAGQNDGGSNAGSAAPSTGASAGRSPTASGTPSPASVVPLTGGVSPISQTDELCSNQRGHRLELGVQITNGSSNAVRIERVRAHLPVPGLRPVAGRVGTCGELPAPAGSFTSTAVAPGATVWLSVTVRVLERCPVSVPVQLRVRYRQDGRSASTTLPGFVDLGEVPYTGCTKP